MIRASRFIFPAILLALLAATASAAEPEIKITARHGQSWRGTVDGLHVLMLRGTHRERGEAHGRLAGAEVVKSADQLASMLQKRLPGGWQAASVVSKQFQVPKRFREELAGLKAGIEQSTTPEQRTLQAAGREISVDDLAVLNATDIFELFRCSQFSAWGPACQEGGLIIGRNFDYPPILPRENFCILAVDPAEKELRPTIDALFFGFIGCGIAPFRDDGLYVSPNSGGPSPREILPQEPIAGGFILRTFLETAKPESALDQLTKDLHAHWALPILLHVVPAKTELGKQTPVIVEFTPSATKPTSVLRQPETEVTSLFVANHHVKNSTDLAKGRCGILKSECEKCLTAGNPIGLDEAKTILHAARQNSTYITAIAWPYTGRLHVAIAEPGKVATESRFHHVEWKAVFQAK